MAHEQQMNYVKGLLGDGGCNGRMRNKAVLELGSYNVNGAVRDLFGCDPFVDAPRRYVGVDWRDGPGVDHVSLFHDIPWVEEFDVLLSCNAFEHDPHWRRSIGAGMRALKPGGEIIFCAAGPGYPTHELPAAPAIDYYQNIDPEEFRKHLSGCGADGAMTIFTCPPDVAFHGFKRRPA